MARISRDHDSFKLNLKDLICYKIRGKKSLIETIYLDHTDSGKRMRNRGNVEI